MSDTFKLVGRIKFIGPQKLFTHRELSPRHAEELLDIVLPNSGTLAVFDGKHFNIGIDSVTDYTHVKPSLGSFTPNAKFMDTGPYSESRVYFEKIKITTTLGTRGFPMSRHFYVTLETGEFELNRLLNTTCQEMIDIINTDELLDC